MRLRWLAIPLAAGAVAALRDRARRRGRTRTDGVRTPDGAGLGVAPVRTTATGDVESEDRSGQWADDGGGGTDGGQRPTTARFSTEGGPAAG
jgi:hypothetical protein